MGKKCDHGGEPRWCLFLLRLLECTVSSWAFFWRPQTISGFTTSVNLPRYTPIYEGKFYYPPKRALIQRKPESLPANEPSVVFCWKAWKLACAVHLGWNKENAGKARLCWPQPVKSIHLARGVTASDPLYLCDQGKFIHAPFSGWVNKTQKALICVQKQHQVSQQLVKHVLWALQSRSTKINGLIRKKVKVLLDFLTFF